MAFLSQNIHINTTSVLKNTKTELKQLRSKKTKSQKMNLSRVFSLFFAFDQIAADLIGQNRLRNNLQARNTVKFNSQQLEADYIRFLLNHRETFAKMTKRSDKPASRNNRMVFYRARMLAWNWSIGHFFLHIFK